MKRHVIAAAAGLVLALAGAGNAVAGGLPVPGGLPDATQSATLGDQTVREQRNQSDVTQSQGNGNVNVSPAISLFGDASTSNSQGNDNTASANVEQSNEARQTQSTSQAREQAGGCCDGPSQAASGGEQTIGKQTNSSTIEQKQGNGNVNVSPAVSLFGDASTSNSQGNDNTASANVEQSNEARQTQHVEQEQRTGRGGCCRDDCKRARTCGWKDQPNGHERCCDGRSRPGQDARGGDQTVGEQRNQSDVTQSQGNGNVNVSPAISLAGKKGDGCRSSCAGKQGGHGHGWGDASTTNAQGNGNDAAARAAQSNEARQQQDVSQSSTRSGACKKAMRR